MLLSCAHETKRLPRSGVERMAGRLPPDISFQSFVRFVQGTVDGDICLGSFTDYDLRYFGLETRVLEPLENPFGPKVLPIS